MTEKSSTAYVATRPLDRVDTLLLAALQENGQMRLEDLARRVELATSSVHDRLRRLRRDGGIPCQFLDRQWHRGVRVLRQIAVEGRL